MRFRIDATSLWSEEKLLDEYPELSKFHYEFDGKYAWVTINTLEELLLLKNSVDEDLIIKKPMNDTCMALEIYDDYRE